MRHETRREFLRRSGQLAVGAVCARWAATPGRGDEVAATLPAIGALPSTGPIRPEEKSVVAHIRRKQVVDGAKFHEILLGEMIEDGVRVVTNANTARDGWRQLIKPDEIIGIKFNHVGCDELGTTEALATRLVRSLEQAGFSPEQIMLIEAPERLTRGLKTRPRPFGWSGGPVPFGSGEEELSAVLGEVTAIINVPFLKTHNIAGMTGCLKNLSHAFVRRPAKYHANGCAPFVGDIVALPQIRSKLRLHIVNAIRAVYRGGPAVTPAGIWTHAGLVVSTDPVAADAVGLDILNEQRAQAQLPLIGDGQGHVAHVHAAAERGLGTDDQDYIHLVTPEPL